MRVVREQLLERWSSSARALGVRLGARDGRPRRVDLRVGARHAERGARHRGLRGVQVARRARGDDLLLSARGTELGVRGRELRLRLIELGAELLIFELEHHVALLRRAGCP